MKLHSPDRSGVGHHPTGQVGTGRDPSVEHPDGDAGGVLEATDLGRACYNPAAQPNDRPGVRLEASGPTGAQRSPCPRRRPPPAPPPSPLAVAVALVGAALIFATGGPAAAQAASNQVTINGTAENKWDLADATVKPGGTVTFKITGGATHPVHSGDGRTRRATTASTPPTAPWTR